MLLDANVLIAAGNRQVPDSERATRWLSERLNGPRRVGIPWLTLGAYLRIMTHPKIFPKPLSPAEAWDDVARWLAAPAVWIPEPGPGYPAILDRLVAEARPTGNLVPDTLLAALAIEHGLTLVSADTDFARFPGLSWTNPLRA